MTIEHIDFGVIPVRRWKKDWEFFLVQHQLGHWSFPKGHQESNETGEQTARRELAEETGISMVDLFAGQTFIEDYHWTNQQGDNHKFVTFYLGLVEDADITIQSSELVDGRWIPADEVEGVLTFPGTQAVFLKARKYLLKNNLWD